MKLFKGVGDFFGLDIGTNSVRVVQLSQRGGVSNPGYNLKAFGYVSIDPQTSLGDSETSRQKLAAAIMTAIGQSGIKTKNVALGIPSSKTFTTVVDMPAQSQLELSKTIKYQIDQYVPMSTNDAKIDWAFLGTFPKDASRQEVLIASTAIDYSEARMDFIESLGLNLIAFEPDQIAMARALKDSSSSPNAANLIIDMGGQNTDLAVVYNSSPRLIRSLPIGLSSIVKTAAQNLGVKEDQAQQFILKFGLAPDKLEGKIYQAVESVLDNFASELNKSVKFFETKYSNVKIEQIIISGYAAIIPMLNNYIANKTNLVTTLGNPWLNISMSSHQQQQLAPIASEFVVALGLARRANKNV